MAAAAMGNTFSDAIGVFSSGVIEDIAKSSPGKFHLLPLGFVASSRAAREEDRMLPSAATCYTRFTDRHASVTYCYVDEFHSNRQDGRTWCLFAQDIAKDPSLDNQLLFYTIRDFTHHITLSHV